MTLGRKTGGRKAGTPNRATAARAAEIAASGEVPLDYLLRVMRDPDADVRRRDAAAIAAAPYVHPKLAAIEHTGANGGAIEVLSEDQVDARIAELLAKAGLDAASFDRKDH